MFKRIWQSMPLRVLMISVGGFLVLYLGMTIYFTNHYFFQTTINGVKVSGKTVAQAEQMLQDEIQSYILTLRGRNDVTTTIAAKDISLTYVKNDELQQILQDQMALFWIASLFDKDTREVTDCTNFDADALQKKVLHSPFFSKKNNKKPKNAYVTYMEHQGYYVVNEERGARVKKEALLQATNDAVTTLQETLSLDAADCYQQPKYTADSSEIQALYAKVQRLTQAKIVYQFGKKTEVVDGDVIKDWITLNRKKATGKLDQAKIHKYVSALASKYNTKGGKRIFQSSTGHKVAVSGGDYGWVLDTEKETKVLTKLICKGKEKTKQPAYIQKAICFGKHDWGNTYVEVNLSKQHLWYYKKGKLVIQSDFVSGNVRKHTVTPQGTYAVIYLERNAILGARSNASYRTPVDYWMPFNGGIGLHDAKWRSRFGGNIYLTNGSHGCINLPHAVAGKIFENMQRGTPVICYYDIPV